MERVLLDTDTLSEVIRRKNAEVLQHATEYLSAHGQFTFSIITRYEILRGLKAKGAANQAELFDEQCRRSLVLPLDDRVIVSAAQVYADLYRQGRLIGDADVLIAAAALVHGLPIVTGNVDHFARVPGLKVESWHIAML